MSDRQRLHWHTGQHGDFTAHVDALSCMDRSGYCGSVRPPDAVPGIWLWQNWRMESGTTIDGWLARRIVELSWFNPLQPIAEIKETADLDKSQLARVRKP